MRFAKSVMYWFLGYCVLFIPYPFYVFSFQEKISNFLFSKLTTQVADIVFGITLKKMPITSDSTTMYVLVLLLFLFAILTVFVLSFHPFGGQVFSTIKVDRSFWEKYETRFFAFLRVIFIYYLSMQLLKYGFNKIFKWQFYLPEPNILYTPVGEVSKDLLFWTSMGTSYSYNVFMGMLEVVPAIFLLFKKTRTIGLLILIPVMINVVAINFSFDISVKIYSLFLLTLSLFLFFPHLKSIYLFFIKNLSTDKVEIKTSLAEPFQFRFENTFLQTSIKAFVIGMIFLEALFPYVSSWNFNDDIAARPYLHGAYEVQTIFQKKDSLSEVPIFIDRFFIHRNGYIIFSLNGRQVQQKNKMRDFKLNINQSSQQFELTDYQLQTTSLNYTYSPTDSILQIQFFQNKNEYLLKAKALDWKKLPALQNDFHWNVDEIK